MPLALIQTPRYTAEALALFSFSHARDHDEIDDALRARGVDSPAVPLDPMPPLDAAGPWLLNHQLKHDAMNQALGLDSSDLTGFDLTNEAGFDAFAGENYSDHASARQRLDR